MLCVLYVDEEVRAGIDAADYKLVTVALTLMHGNTRDVARDVGEALEVLISDEILGHDGDRLRNIDQRGVGLGRDRRAVCVNADRARTGILRYRESLWCCGWLRPPRGLRATLDARIGTLCGHAIGTASRRRGSDFDWWKLRSCLRLLCRSSCLRMRRRRADYHAERGVAHKKQSRLEAGDHRNASPGVVVHFFVDRVDCRA